MKLTCATGWLILGLGVAQVAWCQTTLGELQQKGAVKLSAQDMRSVVAGAKVTNMTANGNVQTWEDEEGGKFVARSSNASTAGGRSTQGTGTWQVEDAGRYCVEITWPMSKEKWCRFLFKSGDKYFASASDRKPESRLYQIEFRK
jgi:hypothetical protein